MIPNVVRAAYSRVPEALQRAVLVRRRQPIWVNAGIVFIHIPKAAGTAINEALYGRFMGHVRAADLERWGSPAAKALPRFAITRNPWDRLVSAYRFVTRGGGIGGSNAGRVRHPQQYCGPQFETFERFVNEWLAPREVGKLDPAFRPQHLYVCREEAVIVDHLGRLEDLAPTYEFLFSTVPHLPPIGHSNRSGEPVDYRTFYNTRLVELVGALYAEDIRRFRYGFE